MLVAKLSDEFLVTGKPVSIEQFMYGLREMFEVGKIVNGPRFTFMGCDIEHREDGSILF